MLQCSTVPGSKINPHGIMYGVCVCVTGVISPQGCSFVFSCVSFSPHNLGQSPHNLSEKVCQNRGEIWEFKDFDGTLSSFNQFSPLNLFREATPLISPLSLTLTAPLASHLPIPNPPLPASLVGELSCITAAIRLREKGSTLAS